MRRRKVLLLARSALVGVLLFVAYYLLPLDKPEDIGVLLLVGGLILIGVVVAWQVRAILNAPFPRLRGFQTLISGIPLLLVVFAAVFYLNHGTRSCPRCRCADIASSSCRTGRVSRVSRAGNRQKGWCSLGVM